MTRMKFLNIEMIQWIFQLMGNHISCMHLSSSSSSSSSSSPSSPPNLRTIKLIKSDGTVKIYNQPINASELMLEFPKHLVCHSDSFYIGKKIPPLSENDKLQLGQKYFLLPTHFFQSVLSFVTIASSFAASQSSKNAFLKKAGTCQPFDIQKTPSGSLQIRVSDEFISNLMEEEGTKIKNQRDEEEEEEEDDDDLTSRGRGRVELCTTPQLQKDYKQLVGCNRRQWKPKLDSIKESEMRKLGSFGIKRRKKSELKEIPQKNKSTQKSENLHSKCRLLHQLQSTSSRSN